MLKEIKFCLYKTRVAVILSSVFCALTVIAQESVSDKLNYVLTHLDKREGYELYNQITDKDLQQVSDSDLFNYHYLGAYFNSENFTDRPNHEKAVTHLKEAKRLCETSLGIYLPSYMEIMKALGDEYLEMKQYEDALHSYQEGIVKSMAIRDSNPQYFGSLIMGVQECYEKMGFYSEVPKNLMDAWSFWDKDIEPFDIYNYYPLWNLCQFYYRYGMYEKALQINNKIIEFIAQNENNTTPLLLGSEYYYRGNILVNMGNNEEAFQAYKEGITLLKAKNCTNDKLYGQLLGNFLSSSGSHNREEILKTLEEIKEYGARTNDSEIYKNALYTIINKLNDQGNYNLALNLNQELQNQNLSIKEKDIIEKQRESINYNKEVVLSLPSLEQQFASLQVGSEDWFEAGHKLSSAYYIQKNNAENLKVLNLMYQLSSNGSSEGQLYHYWILNNLWGVNYEVGNYDESLKFAQEKIEYMKGLSDIPDSYFLGAVNSLVVSKLKTGKIEGIDSDLEENRLLSEKLHGASSSNYSIYLHNRGRAYQLQGKLEDAKRTFLEAINLQNEVAWKTDLKTVSYLIEVEESILEEELER